ncbi:MAG: tetratricopeptide repeat protein [Gemmatimonadota bacterium]|nr:tetratricopeptide repeat protein [Gemmatimonadota bacterium]
MHQRGSTATDKKLPGELERRIRLTIEEFHRWGSMAEGVTSSGRTFYAGGLNDLRRNAASLHGLCNEISSHLGNRLPEECKTLLLAGRLYRRSADYAKACEYFLKALELIHCGEEAPGDRTRLSRPLRKDPSCA